MTQPTRAQRYTNPIALERMAAGSCPECGDAPSSHLSDARFWLPRSCDLTQQGAVDRIVQYQRDTEAAR